MWNLSVLNCRNVPLRMALAFALRLDAHELLRSRRTHGRAPIVPKFFFRPSDGKTYPL